MPDYPGVRPATDADYDAEVARIMDTAPRDEFWVFAYGSLIWNPATEFDREKIAVASGWHRNFCLLDRRYRGNPNNPGLMLCLDRGGTCRGVAYRLPAGRIRENLDRLIRREMSMVPSAFPGRWISVATETGPLRALAFIIKRDDLRYVGGLSLAERADRLAAAHGWKGSMAEYVLSTVRKLEELGIHDRNLWKLQQLVAERIDAAYPADREV
ncbi:MAG: gamma-glutamylcyclotransferase [Devosia sp.]|nr:gamma-glutamylcyclotransferase [Devosia sp.]